MKNSSRVKQLMPLIICSVLLLASISQAFILQKSETIQETVFPTQINRDGATYHWFDEFFDANNIDSTYSANYTIDTTQGLVYMKNSYPAWAAYPDWQRLKKIEVTSSGPSTVYQYIIDLTIIYDADMQTDFDDIRFADANAYPLVYWIAERIPSSSAHIYVRIPEIPPGTTQIYLFYGNSTASDASDPTLFTWDEVGGEDQRASWTLTTEGAWDPYVSLGNSQFCVTWEEGEGPEYMPDQSHRLIRRAIHGRFYDTNGSNPSPPYPNDYEISDISAVLHAENPSCAYSQDSNKYLIAYEENPTYSRWQVFIKAALMSPNGFVYTPFTVSQPLQGGTQYFPCNDPSITYDAYSNQFFVVFSKSDTTWNYNVLGKFFDQNGIQIGTQIQIADSVNYEGQPWVVTDNQGHFMVVYEEGPHPSNGPFSLKAKLYDYNGNQIGNAITVATGTTTIDHMYPSVTYNSGTQQFCVVWNTGDGSSGDYNGEIRANLYDNSGTLEHSLIVQTGSVYKIADVVPYLNTMFFVSYDDDYTDENRILARLITSDGVVVAVTQELSDALYGFEKEMANIAVAGSNIIVVWEDDRLTLNVPPTEIRATVWRCEQITGISSITTVIGDEKKRILEATVVSVVIAPEDLVEWDEFEANVTYVQGSSMIFDILDAGYSTVLMSDISPGEPLNGIVESSLRLRARFIRAVPTNSSILDSWGVLATVGSDIEPPWTESTFSPDVPNGQNGWYVSPINITLEAFDNDSPPENVTTYYRINQGTIQTYIAGSTILFSNQGINNSFEYWSEDNAGNEEFPHNLVGELNIDYTDPFITILKPADIVPPGDVLINGTVTEYGSGSGIELLRIRINDETVFEDTYNVYFTCFDWMFSANYGESYDILVQAFDVAGNMGRDRKQVLCSERGLYEPGYLYLFDNPKYGPVKLLVSFNLAVAIDQNSLFVAVPSVHPDATSVHFITHKLILEGEEVFIDDNVSDGVFLDIPISSGMYELTATAFDKNNVALEDYVIISKIIVLML